MSPCLGDLRLQALVTGVALLEGVRLALHEVPEALVVVQFSDPIGNGNGVVPVLLEADLEDWLEVRRCVLEPFRPQADRRCRRLTRACHVP
jgi:hypothetical protein